MKYKKERKQTYKDTGLNTLLKKLEKQVKEKGEQSVIDSIEYSIGNNWSGIYEPKTDNKSKVERESNEVNMGNNRHSDIKGLIVY